METWRLLHTWEAEPGFNMALDEALLLGTGAPSLRFYTWRPAALSLGYFQRWADVAREGAERADVCVRRMTGGGAIHHAAELTFSIVAPESHALYRGPLRDSYARVHEAIAQALEPLGVSARLRGDTELASDRAGSAMCFQHSTDLDLAWDGAKGVGSAQRRTRGRVLHHGSIKLGRTDLEPTVATLHARAPALQAEELAEAVAVSLARCHGLAFERTDPSAEENEGAHSRTAFFTSREHVRRR